MDAWRLGRNGGLERSLVWSPQLHAQLDDAAVARPAAPPFEQATLGGMTSVRGYQTDTVISHAVGTLQQELWAPIPGTDPCDAGFGGWLYRHLRLATFFDVGAMAQPLTEDDPIRTGLGLGMRVLLGPLTLRADWGHRTPRRARWRPARQPVCERPAQFCASFPRLK